MKFTLYNDIISKKGSSTWIEKGQYPVVRLFDEKRVLIDVGQTIDIRQLVLVSLNKGSISMSCPII